jgi:cysteine desulfurase
MEPEVLEVVIKYMRDEYGNAGSRTHEYGARAKQAVERAREQVAAVVEAQPEEVIFTSGATESNNLAILGLRDEGLKTRRRHVVTTMIEHKSVLEPFAELAKSGFDVTYVPPEPDGAVDPQKVLDACRRDTLLLSTMAVNNETGVIQPVKEITDLLGNHGAYFHVDAAQAFGKLPALLTNNRIDLISVSAHKLFAPKGIGALVQRRRNGQTMPLRPLLFGGGQERGLRPGTQPVPLIAGLGHASQLAIAAWRTWITACENQKQRARSALSRLDFKDNGDTRRIVPWIMNISVAGINSEAAMVALKRIAATSNGAACTSSIYSSSHVLAAMGDASHAEHAIRFSWSHLTEPADWDSIVSQLEQLI